MRCCKTSNAYTRGNMKQVTLLPLHTSFHIRNTRQPNKIYQNSLEHVQNRMRSVHKNNNKPQELSFEERYGLLYLIKQKIKETKLPTSGGSV